MKFACGGLFCLLLLTYAARCPGRVYATRRLEEPVALAHLNPFRWNLPDSARNDRYDYASSVPPQVHVDKRAQGSKYGDARATAHRIDSACVK